MSLVTLVGLVAMIAYRAAGAFLLAERPRLRGDDDERGLVGQSASSIARNHGEEEYKIEKVSRIAGDRWLFQARLKIGARDVMSHPHHILWAGDTPVITLTDLSIPGMGSYSARVLLFRDHYAGTWMGGEGGGHVFGDIVRRDD
jgi:hypothetical protein